MIKVLIVDDHPIIRAGLKQILRETPDFDVAGEASNSEEAIRQAGEHEFEVVLLDISMPGRNGLEVLSQLKSLKSAVNVLVLTA